MLRLECTWRAPLVFFFLALTLRLLFWQATPDASAAYPACYKGDAPYWMAYARAIQSSQPFELGLPLRPPGVAYLLALIWNGADSGFAAVRWLWCVLGAGAVALMVLSARRSFGWRVALVAGLLTAGSTGLLMLSTSPNNEAPYLLLVMGAFALWEPLLKRPRLHHLFGWAFLNALGCLIRVEHLLLFGLLSACLLWRWRERRWKEGLARLGVVVFLFLLVLAPWHILAWKRIARFNSESPRLDPSVEAATARLEQALGGVRWDESALRAREELPAFARRASANFVAATVALQGRTEVTGPDFQILEEAFGSRPVPVHSYPFVALYGGLNFFLANNPEATGGFSRAPLEKPPPLRGGASRYPGFLISGLPPAQLTLMYPPHLEILNRGLAMGIDWIKSNPGAFLSLLSRKAQFFADGALLGVGGYNLPLGLSGTRRPVDLTVPPGSPRSYAWRSLVLVMALAGLWIGRRNPGLTPWMALLITKVLASLVFFGYAREGATVIPALAVLTGLAVEGAVNRLGRPDTGCGGLVATPSRSRVWLLSGLLAGGVLVGIEFVRWTTGPVLMLDGREVGAVDPFPPSDYQERLLLVN